MKKLRHSFHHKVTTAILAFLLLFVLLAITGKIIPNMRLDATAEKFFTLSPASEDILARHDTKIEMILFASSDIPYYSPSFAVYANRVTDLLETIAKESNAITLRKISPEAFSEEEDMALRYGIQAVPANDQGETIYFGLVIKKQDDNLATQIIPFFAPEREAMIEYDVMRLVTQLQNQKRPNILLLSSLPLQGNPMARLLGQGAPDEWAILPYLRQHYDVWPIQNVADDLNQNNPEDILLIAHPPKLAPDELYAIDQWVVRGGKALIFLDPLAESVARQTPNPLAPEEANVSSDLAPLLNKWGVAYDPDLVVADQKLAQRVRVENLDSPLAMIDHPFWLALKDQAINHDMPLVGDIHFLQLGYSGFFEALPNAKTNITPLLFSSNQSTTMRRENIDINDPLTALRQMQSDDHQKWLGVQITGKMESAFQDGFAGNAPNSDEDEPTQPPLPFLKTGNHESRIFLFADSDLLRDDFWVNAQDFLGQRVFMPQSDNAFLVLNALDMLAGDDALLSLRGRQSYGRPFTLLEDIRQAAEIRFLNEEKNLEDQLRATQAELQKLQTTPEASAEKDQALENFRLQLIETRHRLRRVQHALRQDLQYTQNWILFANLLLAPFLLILFWGIRAYLSSRRD